MPVTVALIVACVAAGASGRRLAGVVPAALAAGFYVGIRAGWWGEAIEEPAAAALAAAALFGLATLLGFGLRRGAQLLAARRGPPRGVHPH